MNEITYTEKSILVNGEELLLTDITNRCYQEKLKNNKLVLLTIRWAGYTGWDGAEETIVVEEDRANKFVEEFKGYTVFFGDIAGKHSDVYGELKREHILISTNVDSLSKFLQANPSGHKYNHSFIGAIGDQLEYEPHTMNKSEFLELFKTYNTLMWI